MTDFERGRVTKKYNEMVKEHKRLVTLYQVCSDPERKAFLGTRANLYRDNLIKLFNLKRA